MIMPSHKVRIFVASDPVDFRKGHDGLAALVQSHRLKLIYWYGSGLVMAYKRLEDNSFKWPAIKNGVMRLEPAQFEALFAGLDWRRVQPLEVTAPSAAE